MTATFDLDTVQVLAFTITAYFCLLMPSRPCFGFKRIRCFTGAQYGTVWLEALRRLVDAAIRLILGLWWSWAAKGWLRYQENQIFIMEFNSV